MSEETDYQVSHDVDDEPISLGDDVEEFIDFKVETEAVFKRLAEDIYESAEAAIREPLTNSATAIYRANEEYGVDNGVIEFTVKEHSDGLELHIRDNGIGISDGELREVLSYIGRSTNINREELSGKFGMGFLSLWMIAGLDGGFKMHTHSRKDGEEPISGYWKNSGFSRLSTERFEHSMDEDEYGTLFIIQVKDDIRKEQIRSWVEKNSQFCRIPVIYREFNADGSEIFNEDFGDKRVDDGYCGDSVTVTIDTDWFRAVASPEAQNETLVIDVPIQRNYKFRRNSLFRYVDVRFKSETPVVVDGPHRGKKVFSEAEYKIRTEEQDEAITQSQLDTDDVVIPSPTGTRDKLEKKKRFWKWLKEEIEREFERKVNRIVNDVESPEDILNLSLDEKGCLAIHHREGTQNLTLSNHLSQEMLRVVEALSREVTVCQEDTLNKNIDAYKLDTRVRQNGGQVFIGVSINDTKRRVAFEDHDANRVVQVEEADMYDKFSPLGWRKLKEISKSTIDEYDVSEELRQKIAGSESRSANVRNNPGDRELTFHFSNKRRNNKKVTAGEVREHAKEHESLFPASNRDPVKIVLFPSNTERKISQYKWLADDKVATASCPVAVYEYLSDVDGIVHIDKFIEAAEEYEVETSEGTMKGKDLPENTALHYLTPEMVSMFNGQKEMELAAEYVVEHVFTGGYRSPDYDECIYVPITPHDYFTLYPLLKETPVLRGESEYSVPVGSRQSLRNETRMYAYTQLPEWHSSVEIGELLDARMKLTDGGFELVRSLALLHDGGQKPYSERAMPEVSEYHTD